MGAARHKLCGNMSLQNGIPRHRQAVVRADDIALRFHHLPDELLVVKSFLAARGTALEQAVIPLRVEEPLFLKACFLEAVVHIGGEDEIVFVLYQPKQVIVHRLRGLLIAVDPDIAAPIGPVFFHSGIRVEPAGIHIGKAIFCSKIRKIFPKALPGVEKARRGGKPRACTDHNGVGIPEGVFQLLSLRAGGCRALYPNL